MSWNSRSVRIKRIDKLLKTRNRRNIVEGGGGCPTITLGNLTSSTAYYPQPYSDSTSPSGGAAPYNLSVTIGSLPGGLSLNSATGAITGTPTTFGESQTFTIGGVDNNGCAVTPKQYTIVVWAKFINNTPQDFSNNQMLVSVSGLPGTIGGGVQIDSMEFGCTTTDNSLITGNLFYEPNQTAFIGLWGSALGLTDLSGSNITNAVFLRDNTSPIWTGSAPYTGNWSPTVFDPQGFDAFNAVSTNGDWIFEIIYDTEPDGTMDYLAIIFKP